MNCHELKYFIDNSLPRERDAATLAMAQQHMSTCPACSKDMADVLHLEEALAGLTGIAAEDDLADAVIRHINSLHSLRLLPYCQTGVACHDIKGGRITHACLRLLVSTDWSQLVSESCPPADQWQVAGHSGIGYAGFQVLVPTLIGVALTVIGLAGDAHDVDHEGAPLENL